MQNPQDIVPAAPAATILLLRDDPFEVLMVRRRSKSFYASALVFPGGLVEASDAAPEWLAHVRGADALDESARALRVAACRETYEEAGLLLSGGASAQANTFLDLVAASGAPLDLTALCPFGHWITPEQAPKRFDTHFFLCRAPDNAEPRSDGDETVSVEWVEPKQALQRAEAGETSILFPTLMNLTLLAQSDAAESALAAARARPVFTVKPSMSRREGRTVLSIPAEAGYGLTEYVNPPQSTLLGPRKD